MALVDQQSGGFKFKVHELFKLMFVQIMIMIGGNCLTDCVCCAPGLLPPPENIALAFKDGSLIVTWEMPRHKNTTYKLECTGFQLHMGDQVQYT